MSVRVNLPTLKKFKKKLRKGYQKELQKICEGYVIPEIHRLWRGKKGADGNSFEGKGTTLSPQYKKFKAKGGKAAIPNMVLTGEMTQSMRTKVVRNGAMIYFTGKNNVDKARSNARWRPNFLRLSQNKKVVSGIRKRFRRWLKV
jgi:hypothetical protein